MKSICRRLVSALAVTAIVASLALPAAATTATLKRSIENLTLWPLDVVTTPIVAGQSIYENMQSESDTLAVKIAYPVPGYLWNCMVGFGASVLRGVSGVIELVPGLILLPLDADLDPLYDPPAENPALVDWQNGVYDMRFGVHYTTGGY